MAPGQLPTRGMLGWDGWEGGWRSRSCLHFSNVVASEVVVCSALALGLMSRVFVCSMFLVRRVFGWVEICGNGCMCSL